MTKHKVLLTLCGVLLFVSAARSQSNNAELQGNYALSFNGMTSGGSRAWTPFAAVGRFYADGAGNLINGELDSNGFGPMEKGVALAFTGSYSIGTDQRGVMNLNIPGGGTLAFVMSTGGNAKFVEIDAGGGHGTVGSGSIEKADPSAYATAKIVGDFAMGAAGFDQSNNRTAIAARFTADGMGTLSNGAADVNQFGMFMTLNLLAGTYSVTDGTTGRGVMNLPPLAGGGMTNLDFAFYVVNAGKVFAMEMDAVSPSAPLLNGAMLHQQVPLGGFSGSSLNGNTVMYLTGRMTCPGTANPAPNVIAGLLTTNGLGGANLTYDQNCGGASSLASGLGGTYDVSAGGRAAFHFGTAYFVGYLVSPNQAFFIVPDSSALFGFGEAQAAGPLSNASIAGNYAGVTTTPVSVGTSIFSGEFAADGGSPTGTISGTEDIGALSGPSLGQAVSATYAVSSAPTNRRGVFNGTIGGSGVVYVLSPSKFVAVSLNDANPAVLIFEK